MESEGTVRSVDAPESIAEEVILHVAAHADRDPLEMPQLGKTIDPDHLDALFSGDEPTTCELTFSYWHYDITISYDGELLIELAPRRAPELTASP